MNHHAPPPRGRILLVEDEDLLRWSIKRYLERRGFAVDAAADGAEGLRLLGASRYDVVVTDLAVGGRDGLEIAAEARGASSETQVVIITGRGSKESVLCALRQGVSDFLEKPFDMELLALIVEKALEKTLIVRELVHLARTDGLTGLYNQRHFYAVLEGEMARARRQGHPLALLLVDVDEFKRYNDRHGHLAGDAALARIAACLRRACRRDIDTAYRYGGDEFILLLPEADHATAASVGERIHALLAEERTELTVSLGAAELRAGQDLTALIRAADEAMYRDKRAGASGSRAG